MRALQAAFAQVCSGCGQLRLLSGEPGIGKTWIAEALAAYAQDRGAQVFWGCCSEADGAPAFWPWVQVVRAAIDRLEPDALRTALGSDGAYVAEIVPELRQRQPDLPAAGGLDSPQARFRLFDSITRFLENVARQTPVVLILDDLDRADRSALLLLQFVAREMRRIPLLLVGTYRDLERDHPLSETFAELLRAPGAARLVLSGLSEPEVARCIEITVGVKPSPTLATALHRRTEGNPLFVAEYVRVLLDERGRSAIGSPQSAVSTAIPMSVKAVLKRRLAPLSAECTQVLSVAAAIGCEFRLEVLEHVVAAQDGALLPAVLEEAVAARVLVKEPDAVGRYRFFHALMRETLYEELSASRRLQLHLQIAEAIEAQPDADEHAVELAHHFFEVGPEGDKGKAVLYASRAARRARDLLAYEEASRLWQLALCALERRVAASPWYPEGLTAIRATQCELLLGLAEVRRLAGETANARKLFLQVADIARKIRAAELLARAALGCGWRASSGDPDPELIRLLEESCQALGEEESALRARVLACLGNELVRGPAATQQRGVELGRQAVAIARRVGDPATLCSALRNWYFTDFRPENLHARLDAAQEIVGLGETAGDPEMTLEGSRMRAAAFLEQGDIAAMERQIETFARLAANLRQPRWLWCAWLFRSTCALLKGRFEVAHHAAEQALTFGQRAEEPDAPAFYWVQHFFVLFMQGRLEDLRALLPTAMPEVEGALWNWGWRAGLACVQMEIGYESEARAGFEQLAAHDFSDQPCDTSWFLATCFLAVLCAGFDDARRAAPLYQAFLPYKDRNVTNPSANQCHGSASRYLGLLATTLSDWDAAAAHFEDALRMNTRMGARPYVAFTQYDYASMLLRRNAPGDRDRAMQLLGGALRLAEELGMKSLHERAQARRENAECPANSSLQPSAISHQHEDWGEGSPIGRTPGARETMFRREGDYWTIAYGGTVLRLRDTKGLRYVAELLRHPGQEFLALDLAATEFPACCGRPSLNTGPILDAQAKAAYKHRLDELRDELREAEAHHDPGRAAHACEEIELISEQLAAAVGLGGRDRAGPSPAERARQTVTKGIKAAIAKICAGNPALGRHLAATVSTGCFCTYAPDPDQPIAWLF